MTSSIKQKNNSYMKESEISIVHWTCLNKIEDSIISASKTWWINMIKKQILESAFSSSTRLRNTDIAKLTLNTSISLNIYILKDLGYHHNFTRNSQLFNNTDHPLSGQSDVPSNIPTTSPRASNNPPVPATPMASTPSSSMDSAPITAPRHPSSSSRHTCKTDDHIKKWVINLSKAPLTTGQLSLLQKGPNFGITPKYPPW